MDARRLPPAVLAAATDRAGGALEVAATALDGLLEVAGDPELLEEAASVLETGQPAMAPIWHLAEAARGPDPRSVLAALRARLAADADAAVEAATAWLLDRLAAHPGAAHPGQGAVATVSHSSLVDRVMGRVAGAHRSHSPLSVGPQHGRVAQPELEGAGLSTAPVVGVVGADAIGPAALLNAGGTRELAGRVPTLVVATAVKLVPEAVFGRLGAAGFEVVPLEALAAVVVGSEVLSPAEAGRRARELPPG
jgi:hypothetical protein